MDYWTILIVLISRYCIRTSGIWEAEVSQEQRNLYAEDVATQCNWAHEQTVSQRHDRFVLRQKQVSVV